MKNTILTMAQLVQFCEKNKVYNFSSEETGKKILVHSYQDFENIEYEEDDTKFYAKVRVCHTEKNRNGSYISEDNMIKNMGTLKYAPFLANIHQLDDGTYDFHSHDYHIEKNDNGEEEIVYDESQVGTFVADEPYLEYDKKMKKTYVVSTVVIPKTYTKTVDILKEKNGTKVSCELLINDLAYNAKEKYLEITDFSFLGCTALGKEKDGTEIGEGMLGSKVVFEDFTNEEIISNYQSLISEFQERLERLESACFDNKLQSKEGGTTMFEELLAKYNVTVDDIDFEYEGLSDEELSAKFEEKFGEVSDETNTDETTDNDESTPSEDVNEENGETTDESGAAEDNAGETEGETTEENAEETTEDETEAGTDTEDAAQFSDLTRTFSISHDDIRYGLYNLLAQYEEIDNEWYFITAVYDDNFVFESMFNGSIYGQKYTKENDTVAFDGERYNLHREYLTDTEYAELNNMRSNYAELVEFKFKTEYAQKEAIINDEKYSAITGKNENGEYTNTAFAELVKNMDNYSVQEIETQIKVIYSDYALANMNFSAKTDNKPKVNTLTFANVTKTKKPSRYGNLKFN